MAMEQIRVLLIDDDQDDHLIVEELCEEIDVAVDLDGAISFDEGVELLEAQTYDVCLLDYRLGARSGLDLLKVARERGWTVPIILLTGQGDAAVDMSALRSGAEDYLNKSDLTAALLSRSLRYAVRRAQTVRELRESQERYALSALGSNDGIWDWDLRSGRVFYSDRWKAMLGWEPSDVGDDTGEWFGRVHRKDAQRLQQDLSAHLKGVAPFFQCEHRLLHRNGSYRWMLTRGVAIRDPEGQPYRIAGSQTDITARREQEEELLSHVTHELRTPLNALYQYTSIVHDEITGPLTPKQKDILRRSLANIDQLNVMIRDLMESTRIQTGKFAVEPRRILLEEVVEGALDSLRLSAESAGLELRGELDPELPPVFGDPDRIRQVLINLCGNAMKFTDPGGSITFRMGRLEADPDFAFVAVCDTGRGIDPESTQIIFERLNQADLGDEVSRKGLGLGLHICREIVVRQGGQIWVESEVGVGSDFYLTLPIFDLMRVLGNALPSLPENPEGLAVLEVQLEADGMGALDPGVLEEAREIVSRCLIADLDVILPDLDDDEESGRIRILSFCSPEGRRRIQARLEERLGQADELAGFAVRVEGDDLELPRDFRQLDAKERLKVVARRVDQQLEARIPSMTGA